MLEKINPGGGERDGKNSDCSRVNVRQKGEKDVDKQQNTTTAKV